jgi:KDO2-lipid IV(A) lauroyltransferase
VGKWLFKILVLPLLYFLSVLPFWFLFLISDVLFVLIYYVVGYRRKVVAENLRKSFPEKSQQERNEIARRFYLHFCDTLLETIKVLTISKEAFKKHCYFTEKATNIFHHYEREKRGFICVLGHCGNWEWTSIGHQIYFNVLLTGIYHPLSNQEMDALIYRLRTRFGGNMVPMKNTFREIIEQKKKGLVSNLGLIADQTPPPEGAYWTTFMNQPTPVFYGTEKIAKKFNYPVVFISMKKLKRGHYEIDGEVLADQPGNFPEGELSEMHTRTLEKHIREQPYAWLWSHRRWKHKKPD